MPVGTRGAIRYLSAQDYEQLGAQIVLGNTYHLMLRPTAERVKKLGGLHKFMKWPHPILTDSGGFQVFSLPSACTVSEEGATFRSYVDHRTVLLSPPSCPGAPFSSAFGCALGVTRCRPSCWMSRVWPFSGDCGAGALGAPPFPTGPTRFLTAPTPRLCPLRRRPRLLLLPHQL